MISINSLINLALFSLISLLEILRFKILNSSSFEVKFWFSETDAAFEEINIRIVNEDIITKRTICIIRWLFDSILKSLRYHVVIKKNPLKIEYIKTIIFKDGKIPKVDDFELSFAPIKIKVETNQFNPDKIINQLIVIQK